MEFKKWTSIESFHNVVKAINYRKYSEYLDTVGNKIEYFGKIKLHGTNASVTITPLGKVIAGKRSSYLPEGGIGGDNAGFAAWVKKHEDYFKSLAGEAPITIYGEWCGPGIQSDVACSLTDRKLFYVYAVDTTYEDGRSRCYEPDAISFMMFNNDDRENDDIIVLPINCRIMLDLKDADSLKNTLNNINKEVETIGALDPLMEELFGIKGKGEGLVFYPTIKTIGYYDGDWENELFSVLTFKAKSEEHRVNKTKVAVSADPEKIATLKNFGEMFCTEARFKQGLQEACSGELDFKLISKFIQWCCMDVMKESEAERELIDLPWEKLSKAVASRAAEWYRKQCQSLTTL